MPALKKAEVAEQDAAIAKEVINSYPKIGPASPASWIAFNNAYDKTYKSILYVCHYQLNNPGQRWCDNIITNFYGYQEVELKWFDYLRNYLFKDYADRIELVDSGIPITKDKLDGHRAHTDEWDGKNWQYIKISKLDSIPANVVYDFCIASRVIIEYRQQLAAWGAMTNAGIHPGLAYRLSHSIDGAIDQSRGARDVGLKGFKDAKDVLKYKIARVGCGYGHWAFDPGVDVMRLVEGNPDPSAMAKLSYRENPRASTPCNVIWGSLGRKAEEGLVGKTIEEISAMYGLKIGEVVPPKAVPFFLGKKAPAKPRAKKAADVEAGAVVEGAAVAVAAAAPGLGDILADAMAPPMPQPVPVEPAGFQEFDQLDLDEDDDDINDFHDFDLDDDDDDDFDRGEVDPEEDFR